MTPRDLPPMLCPFVGCALQMDLYAITLTSEHWECPMHHRLFCKVAVAVAYTEPSDPTLCNVCLKEQHLPGELHCSGCEKRYGNYLN